MKNTLIAVLAVSVLVVAFVLSDRSNNPSLGNIQAGSTVATSSANVSTTVALILASSSGRQFVALSNKTQIVTWLYCGEDTTGMVAGASYPLYGSTTLTMTEEDGTMWCTKSLYGITSAGTSSIATLQIQ